MNGHPAWNGAFQFRAISVRGAPTGRSVVLRPILTVDLQYQGRDFPTFALIDSGADWSVLPWEIAEELGIDVAALPGPDRPISGVTAPGRGRIVNVELLFEAGARYQSPRMTLPFMALYRPQEAGSSNASASKSLLIGRHPFFEWFDVHFRMGFTTDPDLGKWTVRASFKKREATRYKKSVAVPGPSVAAP